MGEWAQLDALRGGGLLTLASAGFYLLFRVWKFVSADFVEPYRRDAQEARDRAEEAVRKADEANKKADKCERREARLLLILAQQGITTPPPEMDQ